MDNLQLPHAKLLYIVTELWKSGELNDSEKILLKGKSSIKAHFLPH